MSIRDVRLNLSKSSTKRKQKKSNAMRSVLCVIQLIHMVGVELVTQMLQKVNEDIVHTPDPKTKQKMVQRKIPLSKQIEIGGFVHLFVRLIMIILPKRFRKLRLQS